MGAVPLDLALVRPSLTLLRSHPMAHDVGACSPENHLTETWESRDLHSQEHVTL